VRTRAAVREDLQRIDAVPLPRCSQCGEKTARHYEQVCQERRIVMAAEIRAVIVRAFCDLCDRLRMCRMIVRSVRGKDVVVRVCEECEAKNDDGSSKSNDKSEN
jgi:hypothetical protein